MTKNATLDHITLDGYKSIEHMSLDLRPLNVLIGSNGAGKSNLLSFFALLAHLAERDLKLFAGRAGSASSLFHFGPATTDTISACLAFSLTEAQPSI